MPVSADQIIRLYDTVFDRAPDADGLAFWNGAAAQGVRLDYLAERFMVAPEFAATYGQPTNAAFVAEMYRNILDREGEAEGVSFWTRALDEGLAGRDDVVVGFSESPEHVAQMAAPAQPAEPAPVPVPQPGLVVEAPSPFPVNTLPNGVTQGLWTGGGTILRAPDGRIMIHGNTGADTISGTEGDDLIVGVSYDQTGGQFSAPDPVLSRTEGDDVLRGLGGNDTVHGGGGADAMDGGAGNDVLVGGPGNDTLTGGEGSDAFFFGWAIPGDTFYEYHGGTANDVITDFQVGADKIDLAGYQNFNATGATWRGTGGFVASDNRLQVGITETAEGTVVRYLTNYSGDGGIPEFTPRSAFGGTIELPGVTGLTASDVFLG